MCRNFNPWGKYKKEDGAKMVALEQEDQRPTIQEALQLLNAGADMMNDALKGVDEATDADVDHMVDIIDSMLSDERASRIVNRKIWEASDRIKWQARVDALLDIRKELTGG